ncbi:MAG: DNA-3-methyladenine glycosylase [Longimicrobiales bacterium]
MNVVTGADGFGQAVLLRGLLPVEGIGMMARRRSGRAPIAAGPGRLGQVLGISDDLYRHDLCDPPLRLLPGWAVEDDGVCVSARIGISVAADRLHRFYVRGADGVSKHHA